MYFQTHRHNSRHRNHFKTSWVTYLFLPSRYCECFVKLSDQVPVEASEDRPLRLFWGHFRGISGWTAVGWLLWGRHFVRLLSLITQQLVTNQTLVSTNRPLLLPLCQFLRIKSTSWVGSQCDTRALLLTGYSGPQYAWQIFGCESWSLLIPKTIRKSGSVRVHSNFFPFYNLRRDDNGIFSRSFLPRMYVERWSTVIYLYL